MREGYTGSVSEPWRPRPHDHLVEPLFEGLGQEASASCPARQSRRGALAAIVVVVALALSLICVLAVLLAA